MLMLLSRPQAIINKMRNMQHYYLTMHNSYMNMPVIQRHCKYICVKLPLWKIYMAQIISPQHNPIMILAKFTLSKVTITRL